MLSHQPSRLCIQAHRHLNFRQYSSTYQSLSRSLHSIMAGRSPALIVKPVKQHTATVIFGHGLGDSGAGWMSLASNWRQRGKFDHVRFIFPNAPSVPISVNFGMKMPAWFDVGFNDQDEVSQDATGLLDSKEFFDTLVRNEMTHGIPSQRIIVGGFSQGSAVALLTGVTSAVPLGGIVALSSWLPIASKVPELIEAAKAEGKGGPALETTPFFMAHGERDPLVKYSWGERSRDALQAFGCKNVEWHSYPNLEHSACPEEIDDLEKWLEARLPDVPLEAGPSKA